MEQGFIHIYCGDGAGKTTASVGLAVRAAGRGLRVLFTQFLKNGDSGELFAMETIPGITVFSGAPIKRFLWEMSGPEKQEASRSQAAQLAKAFTLAKEQAYDVLILDEVLPAVSGELVSESALLSFLEARPTSLEVVLTGRDPSPAICAQADYISQIHAVKHPYSKGVPARKGIEF